MFVLATICKHSSHTALYFVLRAMSFDKVAFLEWSASQTKEEMIEVVLDMAQRTKDAQSKVEELQRQLEEPAQKSRKKITI